MRVEGIANFATVEEMLASGVEIDAVSLCQPPQVRHRAARAALEAGADGFGLGSGLYKTGQSPEQVGANARAYIDGLKR